MVSERGGRGRLQVFVNKLKGSGPKSLSTFLGIQLHDTRPSTRRVLRTVVME